MSLADRIIIMSDGKVEQVGSPMDLYLRPASRFVADFIGSPSMNVLDGTVGPDRRSLQLNGSHQIDFGIELPAAAGTQIAMGIRPEHLHQNTAGETQIELSVAFIEQLGADTVVHGTLTGSQTPLAVRLNGVQARDSGDSIALSCAAEQIHLFDSATGQRLNWEQR